MITALDVNNMKHLLNLLSWFNHEPRLLFSFPAT